MARFCSEGGRKSKKKKLCCKLGTLCLFMFLVLMVMWALKAFSIQMSLYHAPPNGLITASSR